MKIGNFFVNVYNEPEYVEYVYVSVWLRFFTRDLVSGMEWRSGELKVRTRLVRVKVRPGDIWGTGWQTVKE